LALAHFLLFINFKQKSLQTQNGFRGQMEFYVGVTNPHTKAPFFIGGPMPFY